LQGFVVSCFSVVLFSGVENSDSAPLLPHEGRHKAMLYNTSLRTLPSRLGLVLAPRPFFLSFLAVVLVVRSQQAGLERSGPDVINPGPAV
jgi:hypothetical protein